MFNNIFWDNRAGTRGLNTVTGIGSVGANDWDMGVFGLAASLAPTNSIVQQNAGTYPYTTSLTNSAANPSVIDATLEIPLTFTSWRTNVNFTGAIMVTAGMPPTLMGNYHLSLVGSPAFNLGAAPGSTKSYTFTANNPGTFVYEAGLVPGMQHQVAMGLYGALIVKPTVSTAFDVEKTLVLSEFDATLAANPIGYDMRKYAPKYFLVNGLAYPNTDLPANQIAVAAGNTVLLRYVNAGLQAHAMSTLGVAQKAIAVDGRSLTHPHSMVAETIAPGQTLDTIVTIPASAAPGTKYALYDANLMLRNSNAAGLGGMLTFLTVPGTSGGTGGSTTTNVALSPNPSNGLSPVTLSATITSGVTASSTSWIPLEQAEPAVLLRVR